MVDGTGLVSDPPGTLPEAETALVDGTGPNPSNRWGNYSSMNIDPARVEEAITERTREIGVLRALGWRRRAILSLIMNESLLLGFLGALAGMALSVGWVTLIQTILIHNDSLKLIWTMENVIRALVVALGLALIGGFYPALRATRLQPVEALRYE